MYDGTGHYYKLQIFSEGKKFKYRWLIIIFAIQHLLTSQSDINGEDKLTGSYDNKRRIMQDHRCNGCITYHHQTKDNGYHNSL